MSPRFAIRVVVPLASLILVSPAGRAQDAPRAAPAGIPSEGEKAIRSLDEAFVRGFGAADSKGLAALLTEDAEVVEADGARYHGRESIERSFADTFGASPGAKIAFEVDSVRLLGPDAAKEEGRSVITPRSGPPVVRLYTVLYVRRDGRWLIDGVREEPDPLARPHDRLRELEWMVGEWVDEAPESATRFDCRWSEDGNFLIRTFAVKREGRPVMAGTQRIGWDPVARQFRSWEFDSEGGFGEGRWSRSGDGWVVKHSAVRPEGTTASATNRMDRVRPDMVRWTSTDRVLGDESVPGEVGYVLVRVPPEPRLKPKAPAPPTAERRPR